MSESVVDKNYDSDKEKFDEVFENGNKTVLFNVENTETTTNNSDTIQNESTSSQTKELQEKQDEMDVIVESNKVSKNEELFSESPKSIVFNSVETCNNKNETINMEAIVTENASIEKPSNLSDLSNRKYFTSSTYSLNDNSGKENVFADSLISRSAEDISNLDKNDSLQGHSDKTKQMTAVHLTPEIPQHLLDAKYVKINRENLSQDFGNIVKNVHGIFSSVSGSLKNVYLSQKVPVKIQKSNVAVKSLVNGRIVEDIFEDETEVKVEELNFKEADIEKTTPAESPQETELATDNTRLQVESLEKMLEEQRKEIGNLRERARQHANEMKERDQMFKDLEWKMDGMTKRVEQAEKDKDLAVMRYANSERTIIEAKKCAQNAQKAEQAAVLEVELLNNKIKSAHAEKQRICQLYDDKCHELQNVERELSKTREDHKELDGRLKWTQSKLRLEIDVNKESTERAEKLSQQVKELEAAKETAVLNAADTLRAKRLESTLKECQASLILCRHEKEDLECRFNAVSQLLDGTKKELDVAKGTLQEQDVKLKQLVESNARLEEEAASLAGLTAQASLAEALAAQLQRETARVSQAEEELCKERARSETCVRREAAALQHAATLTAGNVTHTALREKAQAEARALAADNKCLREQLTVLEAKVCELEKSLADETERRNKENRVLARKVAELSEECDDANKKLEWEKGENAVLKKKHASTIKELNRELQRTLKRCEQLESKRPQSDPETSTRTGSVSSLSSSDNVSTNCEEKVQNGHDYIPEIQVREPDRQALIERIVQLQRAAARRAERCDFLEEHSKQLTTELRKKSRVLRQLMCTLPSGALASTVSDDHKKEIARLGGGAMAAVWGGDSTGMTLELSIEMNRRLQAVLEDTLLKNITLKENMDTLGEEIERLKNKSVG